MHDVSRPPADPRPRLLVLNLYMVYPPNSGAKVVIVNRLRELSKAFRITFCCLGESASDAQAAEALRPFAEVVVAQGAPVGSSSTRAASLREPTAAEFAPKLDAWFASAEMQALLTQRRFDLIELHSSCWFRPCLAAVPGLKVLVAHNREVDYFMDRARVVREMDGARAARPAWRDAALVARQERMAIAAADAVVSLAPIAATEAGAWFGTRPVLSNWGGVDLSYYRDAAVRPVARHTPGGPVLVFVAAFFVEAAVDAAVRFVRDALPAVRQAWPEARLQLVGDHRNHPVMTGLAGHPGVDVVGLVPDVRPYLRGADVVVAPLMRGSGVRYKLMEALAAGKAVVATQKAAEGLGLVHEQDAVLVDTVAEMAPAVVALLGDSARRARLAQQALETASRRFDHVAEHATLARWYYRLLTAAGVSLSHTAPS